MWIDITSPGEEVGGVAKNLYLRELGVGGALLSWLKEVGAKITSCGRSGKRRTRRKLGRECYFSDAGRGEQRYGGVGG